MKPATTIHRSCGRASLTVLSALVLVVPSAWSQQPTTAPAAGATTRPATGPAREGGDDPARQAVADLLKKYRALRSYQDKLNIKLEMKGAAAGGKEVADVEEFTQELLFAPPNRVVLTSPEMGVHCDGKRLWLFAPTLGEYTESAAPPKIDLEEVYEALMSQEPPHLILYALLNPDLELEQLFPMLRGFSDRKREEQDGRAVVRIRGKFDAKNTPFNFGAMLVPITLTIDEQTGVLREVQLDLTEGVRKNAPQMEDEDTEVGRRPQDVRSAVATLTFSDVKLDAEIPAERFVFKPEGDVSKVDAFDWEAAMRGPSPLDFVGRPAPQISGQCLDGSEFKLEAQKGKVVVLDFWATWCVPCVKALPQIQKVHERFKGKPVVVLGMNSDTAKNQDKARKLAKDKKLTFPHFADADGKIGRSFNISQIPCTILIDAKGIVQSVHIGIPPQIEDVEKNLSEEIEKLLKGESLFDPAGIKSKPDNAK